MYDIIIIGAGPAGLTAAIYGCRAGKSVLVLERSTFGGQMTFSPKIENYPGFGEISGNELADKMVEQALALGAEIDVCTVKKIIQQPEKFLIRVVTDSGEFEAISVIIATGVEHRRLGLDNEEMLIGNGISFCAVCDGAFFSGKKVAVIGGGNSAIVEASMLADIADKVFVFQNLPTLTGEATAAKALSERENVNILCNAVVRDYISEDGKLTGIMVKNTETDEMLYYKLDGVFIAIGLKPENSAFADCVMLDEEGYILSFESCDTGALGVYTAGDCRTKKVRQISTATADGAIAALSACNFVDSVKKFI